MSGALGFTERTRLVEALLAVEGMRDLQKRAMYLDELNRELGTTTFFSRDGDARHDVFRIVTSCAGYPGAIQTLVEIVASFHPGTSAVDELRRVVRQIFTDPLLDPARRRQLDRFLSEVGDDELATAYHSSVGPFGPMINLNSADRLAIVGALEEIGAAPGDPPPLVLFLEHLATRLSPGPATALRQWIDGLVEAMRIPDAELRRVREKGTDSTGAARRSYLTVQIEQDALDDQQFVVSVWVQGGDGVGEALRVDEPPLALTDIPAEIDAVLREISHQSPWDLGELFVEVVLPRGLLHHRADQWPVRIGPSDLAYRMGLEYPVVIRCLERIGNRSVRSRWQRKWRWLTANGRHPAPEAVHWVREPGRTTAEALVSDLLLDEHDVPVCMVVAVSPGDGATAHPPEIDAALHAGIPVIVWCTEDRPFDQLEPDVRNLLRHGVTGLPGTVLRLRRDAVRLGEPAGHLGLNVTLLWDDADRVPEPPSPLRAPTRA